MSFDKLDNSINNDIYGLRGPLNTETLNTIEKLIEEQLNSICQNSQRNDNLPTHPNVEKQLNRFKFKDPRYDYQQLNKQFLHYNNKNGKKREYAAITVSINENPQVNQQFPEYDNNSYKKIKVEKSIDLSRYSLESTEPLTRDTLSIIDSYLRFQELTLENLLSKTIINQWAINNDSMVSALENVSSLEQKQVTAINDLNRYRDNFRSQSIKAMETKRLAWEKKLNSNLSLD
ncbi:hypothetical protein TBLA_0C02410 [Henningerozyma blattae CBS 6284]|uniref:Pre-mRNA-splicing factor SPF27 n=1 Tax=Henningerozyma blattae (strain ATCC 34711 / CBS 6284 / DSM 70876 / NBRC 10599 / NRRL Y-10934 / UCD 77-7) TaxID=1071380 RepID=I2H0Z9_HENB6|nr:hypothetical protein TBLA_0C02410 [Tetrapisispora blattae CBS 6284]CCH60051.1 hypothetical protein TBLA_0C02410 [Tetrapisispora blattae CBS 6284]